MLLDSWAKLLKPRVRHLIMAQGTPRPVGHDSAVKQLPQRLCPAVKHSCTKSLTLCVCPSI